jgi:hypothetical protein
MNGTDDIDLSEWWAVLAQGEWFVGTRERDHVLASLHKLHMPFSIQPTKGGGAAPRTDVLVYPWFVDSLVMPEGALWISLDAMPEAAPWAKIIGASEGLKLQQRAKRVGLHLA